MSLSPIEQKNIEAIHTLTGSTDIDKTRSKIDSFKVLVKFQENSLHDRNLVEACIITLNLLPRFLSCVRYQGPNIFSKRLPGSHIKKLNFGTDEWLPSITLVFGKSAEEGNNLLYVDSDGWSVYLSKNKTCPWKSKTVNPLSAIYAGALAVGEVFKELFPEVKSEKIDHLEYDLLTHGISQQPVLEPKLPEIINFEHLSIIGCGAVGQALAYALLVSVKLSGKIHLLDKENLDVSNEQRYVLAFEENRGKSKANLIFEMLSQQNPALQASAISGPFELLSETTSKPGWDNEVVASVDNIKTRINIQAGLPKLLWNVWTEPSQTDL